VKHPEWVDGFIIQNANAYLEGIGPESLRGMKDRYGSLTPEQRAQVDQLISRYFAMFLYQTGVKHPGHLNPDAWNLDAWSLDNPDGHRIQTELIINYYSNIEEYPEVAGLPEEASAAHPCGLGQERSDLPSSRSGSLQARRADDRDSFL
jgi:hypothetical protein